MSKLIFFFSVFLFSITYCFSQQIRCVDVDYYNTKTGTQSSYRLTAEVEHGVLLKLNFPSGHLDQSDFGIINFDNNVSYVKLNGGKTYKIYLLSNKADCFDGVPMAKQCRGITKKGGRCKTKTDNRNGYCWQHGN